MPWRECSKHGVTLRLDKIPVWQGDGTAANPHRIERWVDVFICPVRGCGYSRALKNPNGDRSDNRKTERAREALAQKERNA